MTIYYFSTALSDSIYDAIVKKSNSSPPTFSGVGFDRNVGEGLSTLCDVEGFSYYPITSWPRYNTLLEKEDSFEHNNFKSIVPSMLTLPLIKELWFYWQVKRKIKKKVIKSDDAVIVLSGLYGSLMRPAIWLKKKYSIPIVAIVPDLPEFMIKYKTNYSSLRQFLNNLDMKHSIKFRRNIDAFVLLSKYMNPIVNTGEKPFVVVDGMADIKTEDTSINTVLPIKGDYILYAGKIGRSFGVDKLILAFLNCKLEGVKLCLCGNGDLSEYAYDVCKQNSNIIYLGVIPHAIVKQLERKAILLVEPRPSDSPFVKYSFPSKTLEYMASGTPLLSTNLPCYTEDYIQYQYRVEDESIEGIASSLKKVLSIPRTELNEMGERAKTFVLEEKTIVKQCEKIVGLINHLKNSIDCTEYDNR